MNEMSWQDGILVLIIIAEIVVLLWLGSTILDD